MIHKYNVKKVCCEDISLIENYDIAINSEEIYICHHKLEIELNCSRKELIEKGLYFNRPASELIFLTRNEHISLHNKNIRKETRDKLSKALKGRIFSEETKKKMSEAKKGKTSKLKGTKGLHSSWCKGLTKETSEKLKKAGEKISETRKYKYETGEIINWNTGKKGLQVAWNKGLPKEQQPNFGRHWKIKMKRGWKIDPETGKRKYFIIE